MFYQSYLRSLTAYCLLIYEMAAETNITSIFNNSTVNTPCYLFPKSIESLSFVLTKYNILTAFELYISELINVFLQLRGNSPPDNCYKPRRTHHGIYPALYCTAVTKAKSVEVDSRVCYNWLKMFGIVPREITNLNSNEISSYAEIICFNCVAGSTDIILLVTPRKHLLRIFFENIRYVAFVVCIHLKK